MRNLNAFLSLLCMVVLSTVAGADAFSVEGLIFDPEKRRLRGADVSLQTYQRVNVASSKTDQNGSFTLQNVTSGSYILKVVAAGQIDYEQTIELRGHSQRLEIVLPAAQYATSVTVTAERGRVEELKNLPQQVNVITNEQIQQRAKSVLRRR